MIRVSELDDQTHFGWFLRKVPFSFRYTGNIGRKAVVECYSYPGNSVRSAVVV